MEGTANKATRKDQQKDRISGIIILMETKAVSASEALLLSAFFYQALYVKNHSKDRR
jgi:hypothetical protein